MTSDGILRVLSVLSLALAFPAAPAHAQDDAAGKAPKTGAFQLRVPTRSKTSAIPTVVARMGWGTMEQVKAAAQKDGADVDYQLSNESFEVYVPPNYTGVEPYGLIVWVSAGPGGSPPAHDLPVLDKHKLIWVGANNSGNKRAGWVRLGLAVDAAEHLPTLYKIDPLRVYASGGSGGGRCASMLAMGFPDVFTGGGYPIIGTNYFKIVELPPGENGRPRYYKRAFDRPAAKLFALASKERRHVLLTGDTDANREQTRAYFEAMEKDGFKHVTYLQVPGMGHSLPDAEWFEKGIVALDAGREAVAKSAKPEPAATQAAVSTSAKPQAATAPKGTPPAAAAGTPDEVGGPRAEAEKLMRLAKLYVSNRLYARAREKLNQVIKEHPGSPQADEARKLLKEIGTK